ncbi:hypothetical protein LCGC14_2618370, partial [marine sediment metagenome]
LEKEVDEILGLDANASKTQDKRRAKIEALRKKIIRGKGNNENPIRDFVIVAHNNISEEAEKPYRELEEMLKGRDGEQVLVVNEEIEDYYEGKCFGSRGYTDVKSTLRLGVLTSNIIFEFGNGESDIVSEYSNDYTNLQGPRIILPTEKHVKRDNGLEWKLIEGNIEIPFFETYNLDVNGEKTISTPGIRSSHDFPTHTRRLLINVGNEEVLKYFKSKYILYKDDLSYVEAARFLGIENELPKDFVQDHNKQIYDARLGIITNLRELTGTEKILIDKTDYGKFRGDKDLVDEVAFRLNAPFEKLRETRNTIKRNLERAVEFRMHNEEWILDGERPGETLNVPVYISELCKSYEVDV